MIDPITSSTSLLARSSERDSFAFVTSAKNFIHRYWLDLFFIVAFFVGSFAVRTIQPYNRFFVERDPTLAFPYYAGNILTSYPETGYETVPNWLLPLLIAIPAVIFVVTLIYCRFRCRPEFRVRTVSADKVLYVPLAVISLGQAIALTILATEVLKAFAGRKRPSFFALCNYAGYRDFLRGNGTSYLNDTVAGAIGAIGKCKDLVNLRESQVSFPSGHASLSFVTLGLTGLLSFQLVQARFQANRFLQGGLVFVLTSAAGIIATTRTRDYWHNYDDVLAGSLLGMTVASFVFGIHYYDVVLALRREQDQYDTVQDENLNLPPK